MELLEDGTLIVLFEDARKVGRVLVRDSHNWGGLYYLDDTETEPSTDCSWGKPTNDTK